MKVVVRRSGNSGAIRIPAPVMRAAKLHVDQEVEIREEDGRIVIEPFRVREYDVCSLAAGITEKNRHKSVEMGPLAGIEVW